MVGFCDDLFREGRDGAATAHVGDERHRDQLHERGPQLEHHASRSGEPAGRGQLLHPHEGELLLQHGAEPSLIDKEGNTVDATQIVQTYRALSGKGADEADGAKDEL